MKSITIAIRAMNNDLVIKSLSLLNQIKGERRILFNTKSSGHYLCDILFNATTDWVINVDEDAFIYSIDSLFSLIDYMDENNYHVCGVPDGGVVKCRFHNPIAMNPFFNIFDIRKIKTISKCEPGKETDDRTIGSFTDDLKKYTPYNLIKSDYKYDNFQWQYYPIFFHLLRNDINFLYLNAYEAADGFSSIVDNHYDVDFLIHSWYARCYSDNDPICIEHKPRIKRVYNFAVTKNKTNVGIVVPAFNLDFEILERFINGIRLSNPTVSYKIYFSSDPDNIFTNDLFNRSKSLNYGINQLFNNCEVIICTDIDIIPGPGIIDLTYKKAIQTQGNVFSFVRNIDSIKNWDHYLNNYEKLEMQCSGKGGWNAMTPENWYKSGGWNEELVGWGYEDCELHNRLLKKNINIFSIMNKPIFHMIHQSRSSNQIKTQRNNVDIAKSKDYLNHNWLE